MKRVAIQGGHMVWLMDDTIESGANQSLAEMYVNPGEVSELHCHGNCTEVVYLISGHIRQRINDEWIEMRAGDVCLIPFGAKHQTKNIGDEIAKMVLAYSSGIREYEAV